MMQPPLTQCAKKSLDQAQAEARALNQEFVGTEHLVLGLLKSHGCQVSRVLNEVHVDRDAIRSDMLSVLPYAENPPKITGPLPMSPKAQRAMNSAIVMARSLREPAVSTRVLMLALLEEQGTMLGNAMRDSGVDVQALLKSLAEKPAELEP